MSYLVPIKTALIIFPFLALLITLPYIIYEYHHYGSVNKLRTLIIYSFILYLITIYFLVILPLPTKEEVIKMKVINPQLIPLTFIKDIVEDLIELKQINILKIITIPSIYTVIFNIIMFMPLGVYLRYYYKCSLKKTIIISLLISLFFELTQLTGLYYIYPRPYRNFDVDDLLINTLGGLLGYLIISPIQKHLPTREDIDTKSLKEGQKVSSLRRITLFIGDIFIYLLMIMLVSILINNKYINLSLAVLYFIIIPYYNHNQTIFGRIINVSLEVSRTANNFCFGNLQEFEAAKGTITFIQIPWTTMLMWGVCLHIKLTNPIIDWHVIRNAKCWQLLVNRDTPDYWRRLELIRYRIVSQIRLAVIGSYETGTK